MFHIKKSAKPNLNEVQKLIATRLNQPKKTNSRTQQNCTNTNTKKHQTKQLIPIGIGTTSHCTSCGRKPHPLISNYI